MTATLTLSALSGLLALALVGHAPWRRRWLTGPLLARFREVLPRLSPTEQQALEAGTVGWDAELFSGRPNWSHLLATPPTRLTLGEETFLDGPVETLCGLIDDWRVTHQDHDLSAEAWDFIKAQGFLGLIVPSTYGGLGFSNAAHSAVVMKLATRSVTAAVTVMVPNSLGPAKLLLHYGTGDQKDLYLPRLARGEEIPCFALTGPHAGSDAGATPDTGVICHGTWRGETVLGLKLDWDKRYITLAPVATLIGLAFRCLDPDGLLGGAEDLGITVVLVPRETPGVEIGERHIPLDIPFMNGPIRGHDVFLPLSQVIGDREGIGQGWRMLVESLAEGRGISLPALATGAAKVASRFTGAYAAVRRQFNQPIGRFEGVEEALARIAGLTYRMDSARLLTLAFLDQGERPAVVSAIVKYHLTEGYRRVINDAMDIQGGSGICLGPSNLLGRAYQAIPVAITVEGANILTRSLIIFGQGAIRCHPWVLREMEAAHHPDPVVALDQFERTILGHGRYLLGNLARSLVLGLTRGRLARTPASRARRYYQTLAWMSAVLALTADVAMMTLGGSLKRRERISARLGDVLSELYLASAVLKRYRDDSEPQADYPLVRWALQEGLYRMQEALRALYRNLPSRPLAWLLRLTTFPTGYPFSEPTDHAAHAAAALLLAPSETREPLTQGVYIDPVEDSRTHQLERALAATQALKPLEARLAGLRRAGKLAAQDPQGRGTLGSRQKPALDDLAGLAEAAFGRGLIGTGERSQVRDYLALMDDVVRVDAFAGFADPQVGPTTTVLGRSVPGAVAPLMAPLQELRS
jgi:acyl-CoA dehydrogenase